MNQPLPENGKLKLLTKFGPEDKNDKANVRAAKVVDIEGAVSSEVRILLTLAGIDELWVYPDSNTPASFRD